MRSNYWAAVLVSLFLGLQSRAGIGEAFCGADALLAGLTNELPPLRSSLAMLMQGTENLERRVADRQFSAVHNEDALLALGLTGLQQTTNAPRAVLAEFADRIGALHMLADTETSNAVDAAATHVQQSLRKLLCLFPEQTVADATALAQLRSCHIHTEQVGAPVEKCFRCGARFTRQVSVLKAPRVAQRMQAVVAPAKAEGSYKLRLSLVNHAPLSPGQLLRVHGEKVHLFLLDQTMSDYHHVHPRVGQTPGEYEFEFTPTNAGKYRLWVETHVAPYGFRQYACLDVKSGGGAVTRDGSGSDSVHFALTPASEGMVAGVSARLKLRVTHSDGTPFQELEPFMEAFAHLVGFGENYRTILHTHPVMPPVTDPGARGGPELEFQVLPTEPGEIRFFAQVKIGGALRAIPFRASVTPGEAQEFTVRESGRIPPLPRAARAAR